MERSRSDAKSPESDYTPSESEEEVEEFVIPDETERASRRRFSPLRSQRASCFWDRRRHLYDLVGAVFLILRLPVSSASANIKMKIEEDSEENVEAVAARRVVVRKRAQERIKAEQVVSRSEEDEESGGDFANDETDSEDEAAPQLKPTFVLRDARVSPWEREAEELRPARLVREAKRQAAERREEARRLVEAEVKREMHDDLQMKTSVLGDAGFEVAVVVDSGDDEVEYWDLENQRAYSTEACPR